MLTVDALVALAVQLQEKQAKLSARRQAAAEHAERTAMRCRQLERERTDANTRREQVRCRAACGAHAHGVRAWCSRRSPFDVWP
jgi:hypothetical protein